MGAKHHLWTGDFLLALFISLCAFVGCQALNNGTPLYVTRSGGMTGYAGALILDFSLCAGLARLIAGRIIDTVGRRRIMLIGAVLMLIGTVLAIPLPGLYPQIVLRALQGIGFACVTNDTNHANQILSNVIRFIDEDGRVEIIEQEIEIL